MGRKTGVSHTHTTHQPQAHRYPRHHPQSPMNLREQAFPDLLHFLVSTLVVEITVVVCWRQLSIFFSIRQDHGQDAMARCDTIADTIPIRRAINESIDHDIYIRCIVHVAHRVAVGH